MRVAVCPVDDADLGEAPSELRRGGDVVVEAFDAVGEGRVGGGCGHVRARCIGAWSDNGASRSSPSAAPSARSRPGATVSWSSTGGKAVAVAGTKHARQGRRARSRCRAAPGLRFGRPREAQPSHRCSSPVAPPSQRQAGRASSIATPSSSQAATCSARRAASGADVTRSRNWLSSVAADARSWQPSSAVQRGWFPGCGAGRGIRSRAG